MKNVVKENNLKVRSYSFYESLYEKFHWIKPITHKCFNKEYKIPPLREPSPQRGILLKLKQEDQELFIGFNDSFFVSDDNRPLVDRTIRERKNYNCKKAEVNKFVFMISDICVHPY